MTIINQQTKLLIGDLTIIFMIFAIFATVIVTGYCYNPETVGPWAFGIANEKLGGFVSSNICT
tara:strand:- start:974 stop:1162 length:189 start_codon:yes stop_codon:yes gene_type:complete